MDPLEEGAVHPAMPQGSIGHGAQSSDEFRIATDRPQVNDRRKTNIRLRYVIPGTEVMRIKEEFISAIRIGGRIQSLMLKQNQGNDAQAGHSRDVKSMATAFESLNRSLETFLTRLPRTNERREKSRRVLKKPRWYKDESDGCFDSWI